MLKKVKVQTIYDLNEKYRLVSGADLHEFFRQQGLHPSPSGYERVDAAAAVDFISRNVEAVNQNSSPSVAFTEEEIAAMVAAIEES